MTSCVDYVQSISYKDGCYQIYYKVTLSKLLFIIADENPEEIFRTFDLESSDDFPENVSLSPVNTDLEVGGEAMLYINPRTTDETEISHLPKISGNKCFIPFLLGENETIYNSLDSDSIDDYGESLGEAILSSAKCRILISKNVIPYIETAYFTGKGNQNYSIPVFDYGDEFCIEIPLIVLFQKGMYRTDRIVVIKGTEP